MTFGSFCTSAGIPSAMRLAVVEHEDAVTDLHHQLHVVFDQQDRGAVGADALEQLSEFHGLGRIHPGGRLVQCEQLRIGRERPRDLQAPLVAVGQAARRVVGARRDADVVEQFQRAALDRGLLRQRSPVAQDRADHARPRAHVPPDHHVLQRRQVGEQADVLEGARDAGGGDLVRLEAGDVRARRTETARRRVRRSR